MADGSESACSGFSYESAGRSIDNKHELAPSKVKREPQQKRIKSAACRNLITDSDEPTSSASSSSSVASGYHSNKKGSYFKERIEERVALLKKTYCFSHGNKSQGEHCVAG
eukprot:gene20668-22706_t